MKQAIASRLICACAGWNVPGQINAELVAQFPSLLHLEDELSASKTKGPALTHLQRYAQSLGGVEINSSFYRPHQAATYARWRASVPDEFRFSVKLPKAVTHILRLKNCDVELRKFVMEAEHLKEKLGCLLIQLPPSLSFDYQVAQRFFGLLKQLSHAPLALEPRHATWFQAAAFDLLFENDICLVAAAPGIAGYQVLQEDFPLTSSIAYLRLHGSPHMYRSSYEPEYLDKLSLRVAALSAHCKHIWCVFDNTAEGAAFPNAITLQRQQT
ncbi:DUF72 domain-containing protein [Undibacterium sp. TC4M20W]|uniref:DUF72 domain-containing protein n=1 Tax=Undibacterium sp. TC4M20W TaxID=3413052 RepID=UPI003BF24EA3